MRFLNYVPTRRSIFIERPKPADLHEAMEFIQKVNQEINKKRSLYWAISTGRDPKLIGTICLWNFADHDRIAELGYEMFPAFQGQGFMQEAVHSVLRYGFDEISLKRIEAFTNKENLRSLNLLRKTGFRPEPERTDEDNLIESDIFHIGTLNSEKI